MTDVEQGKAQSPPKVLIVDDEPGTLQMLAHVLAGQGWDTFGVRDLSGANSYMATAQPHVAIVDVFLEEENGLEFVKTLRNSHPEVGILVISTEDKESLAKKARDCGADSFQSKPIAPNALLFNLRKILELREERIKNQNLSEALDRTYTNDAFPGIVSQCDLMLAVLRLIRKVSARDLSVLVCGESGTGKELVARAIHQNSTRKRGEFVELNCAALPPNLVESELFGHEKGAFTGAIASRVGKIEQAHGGTLFLDEIGELPLEIQPKLLRALQERRITRVGGKQEINCDFRLITATHRDLLGEVHGGRFREDLFYRIAVFPVKVPPLRDRMEDLDLLLAHFFKEEGVRDPKLTRGARDLLAAYRWPGNVRELRNFTQAITLLTDRGAIDEAAVRNYFGARLTDNMAPRASTPGSNGSYSFSRPVRRLDDLERDEINYALKTYKGNVPEAAMALGMGRATLYKFISKNEIDLSTFSS
ncbi:sigma-54-dependent Fis family transcriptional regulator [Candidatus Sumerlaeota bacterium]|nr:sigma-54-dependent Fis family transcriptional regulator [Candidatus Sumerlaeota bacterium]